MSKNIYQFLYLVGIAILAFSSCDLSFLNGNRSYQYSLVDGDEISNIPDDEFFNVNIKSAYYTGDSNTFDPLDFVKPYAMDEGPGTDCKISINEESATEDLYCILEVAEGDLWFHEINLQYNVPPGMCPYLAFLPHWHYNQAVGLGPRYVAQYETRRTDQDGNPLIEYIGCSIKPVTQEGIEAHCIGGSYSERSTCEDNGGTWIDEQPSLSLCPPNSQEGYAKEDSNKVCQYIRKEDDQEINCCLGEYELYKDGKKEGDYKWDGDIKNCIGGLARINWDTFDKDGFPAVLIEQAGNKGLKKDYTLYPLYDKIDQSFRSSFPTANYFSGMKDKEWEAKDEPPFYSAQIDGAQKGGKPFVTWACLDQNKEVLHTIRFIIQEWNTKEEFTSFKESEGSRGDPDIGGLTGREGSECDYYENNTLSFGACNDLNDADDFVSLSRICLSLCSRNDTPCKIDCTTVKDKCDDDCSDTKTTCDTDCTTTETQCNSDCEDPDGACKTGCGSDNACVIACDDSNGTCKTACTAAKTTCDTGCTDTEDKCETGCSDTETVCKNECEDTCDTKCTYPSIKYN